MYYSNNCICNNKIIIIISLMLWGIIQIRLLSTCLIKTNFLLFIISSNKESIYRKLCVCVVLTCRLSDLGLETFKLSELFSSILIPGFFLLACILQLHYFHKPFMKITDLEHVTPLHRHEHTCIIPTDIYCTIISYESTHISCWLHQEKH